MFQTKKGITNFGSNKDLIKVQQGFNEKVPFHFLGGEFVNGIGYNHVGPTKGGPTKV